MTSAKRINPDRGEALADTKYGLIMNLEIEVQTLLSGRELLTHPYYQKWEAGELTTQDLAAYGAQYVHFERQLPRTLEKIVRVMEPGPCRDGVQANLDDEVGDPTPHVELLQSFLDAVGSVSTPPGPATHNLTSLYDHAPGVGIGYALGVVAAYEVQSAAIATSKAEVLREWYGLNAYQTTFWDLHSTLEEDHAAWLLMAASSSPAVAFFEGIVASRDAWWDFLSEREASLV
jgi:pyrroloquinoline-quinone synthase